MSVKKHIAQLRVMSCGNALLWGTDFTLRRWRRRRRNWSLDLGSEENNFRFHRDWWHQAAASRWFDVWCVEAKSNSFQWTFPTVLCTLKFLEKHHQNLSVWCLVLWQRSSRSRFKIHDLLFVSFVKRRFEFSLHFTAFLHIYLLQTLTYQICSTSKGLTATRLVAFVAFGLSGLTENLWGGAIEGSSSCSALEHISAS